MCFIRHVVALSQCDPWLLTSPPVVVSLHSPVTLDFILLLEMEAATQVPGVPVVCVPR